MEPELCEVARERLEECWEERWGKDSAEERKGGGWGASHICFIIPHIRALHPLIAYMAQGLH